MRKNSPAPKTGRVLRRWGEPQSDATPRHGPPIGPTDKRLAERVLALLAKTPASQRRIAKRACISQADVSRALNFQPSTKRTLKRLAVAFGVDDYSRLSERDRRAAAAVKKMRDLERERSRLRRLVKKFWEELAQEEEGARGARKKDV